MRTTLTVRHMKNNKMVQDAFDGHVARLSNRLSHFNEESIFIHGNVDKNHHKEQYFCSLTVYLPSMTLHSRDSSFDLLRAVNAAFESIIRQAEKFKAKLRRGHRGKSEEAT
mgnify:FL=1